MPLFNVACLFGAAQREKKIPSSARLPSLSVRLTFTNGCAAVRVRHTEWVGLALDFVCTKIIKKKRSS